MVNSLRTNLTGMNQTQFAIACKIDLKTLRQLERNQISPSVNCFNRILHLFGLQLSFAKQNRQLWRPRTAPLKTSATTVPGKKLMQKPKEDGRRYAGYPDVRKSGALCQ